MTVPKEVEVDIVRLAEAEKWRPGTIANQLGVHHTVVQRVLGQQGMLHTVALRPTLIDPYLPFVMATLDKYPRLPASRLFQMVKQRGYPGGEDHFRSLVARHRPPKPAEAYLRLRTLPAEQAQVDWGHFGHVDVDGGKRKLFAFVMVLSYSRKLFVRFYLSCAMAAFIRGHVEAFLYYQGVARTLLYDNLKSAVLERVGDAIRFHPTLLELAKHYRFEPKPVNVARGNEKGRVERAIRYVRTSFFPARSFRDVDDLNAQAAAWLAEVADGRKCPQQPTRRVDEVFAEEQPRLMSLPATPFVTDERVDVHVGKTPYVRFDRNDYSVPHTKVRRTLTVVASLDTVRVVDGAEVVARHPRCWGVGKQIEQSEHVEALLEHKRRARKHRGMNHLHDATPSSHAFLKLVAERGGNLGATVSRLLTLLDIYGPEALDAALARAAQRGTAHLGAVRHLLDQQRKERDEPPALSSLVSDDPRVRRQLVRTHDLRSYDQLRRSHDDDDTLESA